MSRIRSTWKLTFDPSGSPKVLLNYGDLMDDEISPGLTKPAELVELADAVAPFIRIKLNRSYRLGFTIYQDKASDAAMRKAVFDSLIEVDSLGRKPLRVESNAGMGGYFQFSNAFITEHEPRPSVESGGARLVRSFTILATGLSWTAVP